MAFSNYGELKTEIEEYLERSDLTSKIPGFVQLATSMINRDLRSKENEKRQYADVDTEFVDIPTNFIEMRNFELELYSTSDEEDKVIRKLDYKPPEVIDELFPYNTPGIPQVYTIQGEQFQLRPVPDLEYRANMLFWYRLADFSNDASWNYVLRRYPGLYLYGSLVCAAPFIEDKDQLQTYVDMYNSEIETLNSTDKKGRFSGSHIEATPDVEE